MRFCDAGVEDMVNAMTATVEDGTGTAQFEVYTGTRPVALTDDLDDQIQLVVFDLPHPAFLTAVESTGTVSGWSAVLDTDNVDAAVAIDDGDAAWFRIVSRNGDPVMDGTVSLTGAGGDAAISTVTVATGVDITLVGFTYTLPKGW
jgi:hypothetical protein